MNYLKLVIRRTVEYKCNRLIHKRLVFIKVCIGDGEGNFSLIGSRIDHIHGKGYLYLCITELVIEIAVKYPILVHAE